MAEINRRKQELDGQRAAALKRVRKRIAFVATKSTRRKGRLEIIAEAIAGDVKPILVAALEDCGVGDPSRALAHWVIGETSREGKRSQKIVRNGAISGSAKNAMVAAIVDRLRSRGLIRDDDEEPARTARWLEVGPQVFDTTFVGYDRQNPGRVEAKAWLRQVEAEHLPPVKKGRRPGSNSGDILVERSVSIGSRPCHYPPKWIARWTEAAGEASSLGGVGQPVG